MKFSTCLLAALGLATSAIAVPVAVKRDADITARTPIGSFISIWYGEDGDEGDEGNEKSKRDVEARAPIGSFISIWYGEDGDEGDEGDEKRSVAIKKRAPDVTTRTPIGHEDGVNTLIPEGEVY